MKSWEYFDLSTGILQGRTFRCSDLTATPPHIAGLGTIEGVTDWQSQRVDIETGALVDYIPPQPDADHEWIEQDERGRRVRRWVLSQAVRDRRRRVAEIEAELIAIDLKMIRPLGELAIEPHLSPADLATALEMVTNINQTKAALRAELRDLQSQ